MGEKNENLWCDLLDIERPDLDTYRSNPLATTHSLLIVALLERGEPMTLAQVAQRFEEVGIADFESSLLSLRRCRPDRLPVQRVGDDYHLDPRDDSWPRVLLRLGLRSPDMARPPVRRRESPPLPSEDVPISYEELDEAWTDANLYDWSPRRLTLAILDAQGGRPIDLDEVAERVAERTKHHRILVSSNQWIRKGSPILVDEDGTLRLSRYGQVALRGMRKAVRQRIASIRERSSRHPDPAAIAARVEASERRRKEHAERLARLTRALLVGFPSKKPRAVALLDVDRHTIRTYIDEELAELAARLADFDVLGAENVRSLLRALDIDPGDRRLAELGPPRKTKSLDKRGRVLKITTALLVQGSCGITRPFGDPTKLAKYLANGEFTKLRRRLESDVKSLYALHEYGRLHGSVRLRWGFIDECIPAPWVHFDERSFYELMMTAHGEGRPLEVVVGSAPGWNDPWSRAFLAFVRRGEPHERPWLVDPYGREIDEADVQRARLVSRP